MTEHLGIWIAVAALCVTILTLLCGVFYRLGKTEALKLNRIECERYRESFTFTLQKGSENFAAMKTQIDTLQDTTHEFGLNVARLDRTVSRLQGIVGNGVELTDGSRAG